MSLPAEAARQDDGETARGAVPTRRRRARWLAGMAAYAAVAGLGGHLYFHGPYRRAQEADLLAAWDRELDSRVDVRLRGIERWLADARADVETVAAHFVPAVLPGADAASRGRIRDADRDDLETFARLQRFRSIAVLDASGLPLLVAGPGVDPECAELARSALASGGFRADIVAARDGFAVAAFAARHERSGRPDGAVVATADPREWLYPFLRTTLGLRGGSFESMLVRRDGADALYLSPLAHDPRPVLGVRRRIAGPRLAAFDALEGREGFRADVRDYRGERVLASTRLMNDGRWGLVAKVDRREALAPAEDRVRQAVATYALIASAVGLAAVGVLLMLARAHRSALDRRAAALAAVMDEANDAVFVTSADGKILEANAKAREMYGRPLGDLLGRHPLSLRPPDARTDPDRFMSELAAGQHSVYETVHQRADGARFPVEVSNRVVSWEGRPAVLGIVRDVTERRLAEESLRRARDDLARLNDELEARVEERTRQLAHANRELEGFAYSVSHDLRTPLRAISTFARVLDEDYGSRLDAEGTRVLGLLREGALRMGVLIDDLLAFSRATRLELVKGTVDVQALVASVWAELTAGTPTRARLVLGELPPAFADPALLRQVVSNILGNALKFSAGREAPRIEVAGRREDGAAVYRVSDNGVGFDMRHAHRLFGVFQRLHGDTEFEGTGVGLALVHRVVERHGGTVRAESRPGEGATFIFSLPGEAAR